jgi:hypothetical protein
MNNVPLPPDFDPPWRKTFSEDYAERVVIDNYGGTLYVSAGPGAHYGERTVTTMSARKALELAELLRQAAVIAQGAS